MSSDYDNYVRTEWEMFVSDTQRGHVSLEATAGLQVTRVLDVGCGAGQELLPFAPSAAVCVGVDLSSEAGRAGRELFGGLGLSTKVAFARAIAEALPFRKASFDLVICRLALPYTDNARALAEMARVLSPNGVLLLKIHHARYYWRKFWRGLLARDVLSMVHAARVLAAGMVYHSTGRQTRSRLLSAETFQTEWLLRRELDRCGLEIGRMLPGSNRATPFFLIKARSRT
jgi:ubiquinone/menaquinone biosynthesis C-methylase UbiE